MAGKRADDPLTNPRWTRVADRVAQGLLFAGVACSWWAPSALDGWGPSVLLFASLGIGLAATIERRRLRSKFGDLWPASE